MPTGIKGKDDNQKLGLLALVAIVVSSMIGSGVDGLPQNMAANSEVGPVAIAWLICGFGMFFISRTFIILSNIRPDLQTGIYTYTQQGFGAFCAFIVAWGYWLMTIFSNVAFGIMVMDTLNYFIPGDFRGGNNITSVIGVSILVWGFNFLVLSGTKLAGKIDIVGTIAKLIPLIVFIFILVYLLNVTEITSNIWGNNPSLPQEHLGSVFSQITSPLDVALWCFIGVEGAVALSGRAKNKKDVGKATFIGFVISLVVCILISILPFGVMTQKELSVIPTPSTAGILKVVVGEWGEMLINIGVLISVLSSWLAWTMICAEIPMAAAQNGTFPKSFARKNDKGAASVSLWASSILMQLVVLMVYFSSNAWLAMLAISALTVLPAYLMSTAYLCKLCVTGEYKKYAPNGRKTALVTSLIGILFCLFMVYASEVKYLAMVPILLTLGLPLFIFARIKDSGERNIFQPEEMKFLISLIVLDLFTGFLFLNDTIKF
ncbi:basic amino acid/polyamine antiporter [Hafnia alvei]|uniref:basic amino acid/polyamine antiporter n=1 Tax=Hafnia alvei TaxID=569 RepID=UPI00103AAEEB|nr:basic amino acid/polyamine antiporter [Hafnia alvei]QBJ35295.1 amino acid permease [Hafnia alvei]